MCGIIYSIERQSSPATWIVYVDGIMDDGVGNGLGYITHNRELYIGYTPQDAGVGYIKKASIDDISVWDKVLSSSEVNEIYTSGPSDLSVHSAKLNLKAWWQLEDNGDDSSGNSNTLTINGGDSIFSSEQAVLNSMRPNIIFDGYNKLTIENTPDDVTGITLYHKPTGSEVETSVDIGTASTVNINETGTYRAEIKAISSYTYTENIDVVNIIAPGHTTLNFYFADVKQYNSTSDLSELNLVEIEVLKTDGSKLTSLINITGYDEDYAVTKNMTIAELENDIKTGAGEGKWFRWLTDPMTDFVDTKFLAVDNSGSNVSKIRLYCYNSNYIPNVYIRDQINAPVSFSTSDVSSFTNAIEYTMYTVSIPELTFDGFNKLTIENPPLNITGITLLYKAIGSNIETSAELGTATSIYINQSGTYQVGIRTASEFYYSNTVLVSEGSITIPSTFQVVFHYGNFDNIYNDGNVYQAAANGHIYADTPSGLYLFGTINTVTNNTSQTNYSVKFNEEIFTADVLIVAGGGAGYRPPHGGGGGGGEVIQILNQLISTPGDTIITVGGGGTVTTSETNNGTNSSFGLLAAIGGGIGASWGGIGTDGGSGGGGSLSSASMGKAITLHDQESTTVEHTHRGNNGGLGQYVNENTQTYGGGGGGAGSVGNTTHGGSGIDVSLTFGVNYGYNGQFAGGGGGGGGIQGSASKHRAGGNGSAGGGNGTQQQTYGYNAVQHTGSGGGGGGYGGTSSTTLSGLGGSGIIIIQKKSNP